MPYSKNVLGYNFLSTASATAGNQSSRNCTVSAAASRRHVDASLVRKKAAHAGEINEKKTSQRAPPFSLWMVRV